MKYEKEFEANIGKDELFSIVKNEFLIYDWFQVFWEDDIQLIIKSKRPVFIRRRSDINLPSLKKTYNRYIEVSEVSLKKSEDKFKIKFKLNGILVKFIGIILILAAIEIIRILLLKGIYDGFTEKQAIANAMLYLKIIYPISLIGFLIIFLFKI